jgi:type IV pilus assembly protein PilN
MPRINLLPWRAELRQKRKKEFFVALLAAAMLGGVITYAAKLTMQSWIAGQQNRNSILREEIAGLEKQIAEITGLENQRERLIARMQVIDQLQRSRPEVVHLFDELVESVPEGVHFTAVKQVSERIELEGQAQSSTRVSALMRNIDDSEFLNDASLDVVQTVATGPTRNSTFKLFAKQVSMAKDETDADGGNGGVQ